jgi:hypothetical protein
MKMPDGPGVGVEADLATLQHFADQHAEVGDVVR